VRLNAVSPVALMVPAVAQVLAPVVAIRVPASASLKIATLQL